MTRRRPRRGMVASVWASATVLLLLLISPPTTNAHYWDNLSRDSIHNITLTNIAYDYSFALTSGITISWAIVDNAVLHMQLSVASTPPADVMSTPAAPLPDGVTQACCLYGWVAIGFGSTTMVGADIWMVYMHATEYIGVAGDKWGSAFEGPPSDSARPGGTDNVIANSTWSAFVDGRAIHRFSRSLILSGIDPDFDRDILPGKTKTVIAIHNTATSPLQHERTWAFDIDYYTGVTGECLAVSNSKIDMLHAVSMFVVWGLLYPCGIMFARYTKHSMDWIKIHRTLQMSGVLSTVALAGVGATSVADGSSLKRHHLLGVLISSFLLIQVLSGFISVLKLKSATTRTLGMLFHVTFGSLLVFVAPYQMWLGIELLSPSDQALQASRRDGLISWYAVLVLVFVLAEARHMYANAQRLRVKNKLLASLATLRGYTMAQFTTEVESGKPWIIIDKLIVDITAWIITHPGGQMLLRNAIGDDVTDMFHGRRAFGHLLGDGTVKDDAAAAKGPKHKHSAGASRRLQRSVVGRISDGKLSTPSADDSGDGGDARKARPIASDRRRGGVVLPAINAPHFLRYFVTFQQDMGDVGDAKMKYPSDLTLDLSTMVNEDVQQTWLQYWLIDPVSRSFKFVWQHLKASWCTRRKSYLYDDDDELFEKASDQFDSDDSFSDSEAENDLLEDEVSNVDDGRNSGLRHRPQRAGTLAALFAGRRGKQVSGRTKGRKKVPVVPVLLMDLTLGVPLRSHLSLASSMYARMPFVHPKDKQKASSSTKVRASRFGFGLTKNNDESKAGADNSSPASESSLLVPGTGGANDDDIVLREPKSDSGADRSTRSTAVTVTPSSVSSAVTAKNGGKDAGIYLEPGQHITLFVVTMDVTRTGLISMTSRQYTPIISATQRWRDAPLRRMPLCVRVYPKGKMTQHLAHNLSTNQSIKLRGPLGRSLLHATHPRGCWKRVVVLCAGSGITVGMQLLDHYIQHTRNKIGQLSSLHHDEQDADDAGFGDSDDYSDDDDNADNIGIHSQQPVHKTHVHPYRRRREWLHGRNQVYKPAPASSSSASRPPKYELFFIASATCTRNVMFQHVLNGVACRSHDRHAHDFRLRVLYCLSEQASVHHSDVILPVRSAAPPRDASRHSNQVAPVPDAAEDGGDVENGGVGHAVALTCAQLQVNAGAHALTCRAPHYRTVPIAADSRAVGSDGTRHATRTSRRHSRNARSRHGVNFGDAGDPHSGHARVSYCDDAIEVAAGRHVTAELIGDFVPFLGGGGTGGVGDGDEKLAISSSATAPSATSRPTVSPNADAGNTPKVLSPTWLTQKRQAPPPPPPPELAVALDSASSEFPPISTSRSQSAAALSSPQSPSSSPQSPSHLPSIAAPPQLRKWADDGSTLIVVSGSDAYGQAVSKMLASLGVDVTADCVRFMLGE